MSAPRWIVDRGHAWLEVPLGEAVTASLEVRPVSRFSYVNRELGLAYLEEDCDAGVWIEWRHGADVASAGSGFEAPRPTHRVDGWSWVRDLPRFEVLDSDPRAGGRVTPDDVPGVLS
jgi:hypothetical protein